MRVISNRALTVFAAIHPAANQPLQTWRKAMESGAFLDFASLKRAFNSIDKVGGFHVFDVGGNKYRLVVAIHFNKQAAYVRHVFTHTEYDKWVP
jgi:mRNA interferase HigB